MALHFTSAGSDHLVVGAAPVSAAPLTLAAWFKADNVTENHLPIGLFDDATSIDAFYITAAGGVAGDPLRVVTAAAGSFASVDTIGGFTAGTWHHAGGVFASASSRIAYLDGTASAENTTSMTPTAIDVTWISKWRGGSTVFTNVAVAEAAIWDVALTSGEMAALAKGYSPLFIRPQSLISYWPLIGRNSPESNLIDTTYNLTLSGSGITTVDHPRIFYPTPAQIREFTASPGGGGSTSLRVRGARMRMGLGT